MCSVMGLTDFNPDSFSAKMEEMLAVIRQVNEQFRDPVSIVTVRYQFKVLWFSCFPFCIASFKCICRIVKSVFYLNHVCLSVCLHGGTT